MSVQGATIKRLEFLTSRWDYDIPHKHVWCVDIYGVTKANIDTILDERERRDPRAHWPVERQISLESVRNQFGFLGLAQTVAFPNEAFQIEIADVDNRGGLIPGITGGPRYPYGSENHIDISFLETNIDILDYFIKPWIIATAHKGLIEDGVEETNVKATIEAYLYARAQNRNSVPSLRKHLTFYKCVPYNVQADQVSYGDMSTDDIVKTASFAFERYVVNNINAEDTPPEDFVVPITVLDEK